MDPHLCTNAKLSDHNIQNVPENCFEIPLPWLHFRTGQSTLFFFPPISLKGAFLTFQCKIIAILLKVGSHFFIFFH